MTHYWKPAVQTAKANQTQTGQIAPALILALDRHDSRTTNIDVVTLQEKINLVLNAYGGKEAVTSARMILWIRSRCSRMFRLVLSFQDGLS